LTPIATPRSAARATAESQPKSVDHDAVERFKAKGGRLANAHQRRPKDKHRPLIAGPASR
jgi:hypothetical protein